MVFGRRRNVAPQLHFACQQRPLDVDEIRHLVEEHPLSVQVRGEDGWLPLHRVCRREPPVAVVRCLVRAWPESVEHWTGDGVRELGHRLAIHLACQNGASLEVVQFLAQIQPETLEAKCLDHQMTPLDYAVKSWDDERLPQTAAVIAWIEQSVPSFHRRIRPVEMNLCRGAALEPRASLSICGTQRDSNLPAGLKPPPRARRSVSESTNATVTSITTEGSVLDPVAASPTTADHRAVSNGTQTTAAETVVTQSSSLRLHRRMDSDSTLATGRTDGSVGNNSENSLRHHLPLPLPNNQHLRADAVTRPDLNLVAASPTTADHRAVSNGTQTTAAETVVVPESSSLRLHRRMDSDSTLATARTGGSVGDNSENSLRHHLPLPTPNNQHLRADAVTRPLTIDGTVSKSTISAPPLSSAKPKFRSLKMASKKSLNLEKYARRLHEACMEQPPSLAYVKETMGKCKEAASVPMDYMGYRALHLACMYGANLAVIKCLVQASVESVKVPDNAGYLPLHLCFTNVQASLDIVRYLISHYLWAVADSTTDDHMIPLHCACYYGASTEVVKELVGLYPQGVFELNRDGKTPLDLARNRAPYVPENKQVMNLLIDTADILQSTGI